MLIPPLQGGPERGGETRGGALLALGFEMQRLQR
jgi:hypothetical protein